MQFTTISILSILEWTISGSAIPSSDTSPSNPLAARDKYDCKGSSMCKSLKLKACDDTVNHKIIRNNDVNYGAPGSGRLRTGECTAVFAGYGCGVFIQGGKGCARTGNQIWADYQEIRGHGCKKCGSKHWGDGCLTTINYVSGC